MFNPIDYLTRTKKAIELMLSLSNGVGGVPPELADAINALIGIHNQLSIMTGEGTMITESVFIWFAKAVVDCNDLLAQYLRMAEEFLNSQALAIQNVLEAKGQAKCN